MKTIVWLAIVLTGIAIAIAGAALNAYQEYRLVGNYGAYSISVPVNPYQGAGEALIIVGSLMAVLMLLYTIYTRRNTIGMQPPPPPPPPPEA